MPISSDISVIAWLFLFLPMLSGSEVLYTTDLEHHKSINCAVSINSNPFDNGHPSFPFVLLFCVKNCVDKEKRTGGDDSPDSGSLIAKICVEYCEVGRELKSLYWSRILE